MKPTRNKNKKTKCKDGLLQFMFSMNKEMNKKEMFGSERLAICSILMLAYLDGVGGELVFDEFKEILIKILPSFIEICARFEKQKKSLQKNELTKGEKQNVNLN